MAESSKYNLVMDELASLEKMIHIFNQRSEEVAIRNQHLEKLVETLKEENEVLKIKIKELENRIISKERELDDVAKVDSLSSEEREAFKNKIGDLISRIDYHLRS